MTSPPDPTHHAISEPAPPNFHQLRDTTSESPPIACALGSGDFKDRIGWIRELSAKSLRNHRRDGLMLELAYDAFAAADVHELVRRERACCGFLRFDVRESADAVHLTITAPPEAQGAADELFAHFVA